MLFNTQATVHIVKIHIAIFSFFTMLYYSVGFEEHFECDRDSSEIFTPMYFSAIIHTGLGGECTPKTPTGRRIVAVHTLTSFTTTLMVLATWKRSHV